MPTLPLLPVLLAASLVQPAAAKPNPPQPAQPEIDWRVAEAPLLRHHVQLTFPDRFARAGEAYFSPDGDWIIFQAIPAPTPGVEPDPFYAMYVARLVREGGRVVSLADIARVSPPDSANTCGWFHPTKPERVLFASTVVRPEDEQKSGFQVGTRTYRWMFPAEMEIVEADVFDVSGGLRQKGAPAEATKPSRAGVRADAPVSALFTRPNYDAECSYDSTGRLVLYAHVEDAPSMGRPDANLYVYDIVTKRHIPLVVAPGYDGGPFFSPDDRWITYRSDREGSDLLQLFVAELAYETGPDGVPVPTGIAGEYQITRNRHVNWCPFWHPSGDFLVYASSEAGHHNYEVFAVPVPHDLLRAGEITPEELRHVRVTHAAGADVLPAFSPDGSLMMWTSQRGPKAEGEQRPSSQIWIAEWVGNNPFATEIRGDAATSSEAVAP